MKPKTIIGCLALLVLGCVFLTASLGFVISRNQLALSNVTLSDGDTVRGNLIIAGHNGLIENGARVTGSVIVLGGNVHLLGEVGGNIVVSGGNAMLSPGAELGGRVFNFGGSVSGLD